MTRAQSGRLGGIASAITRQSAAEHGRAFARAYRERTRPTAYTGPYPILSHRTCAEIASLHAGGDAR